MIESDASGVAFSVHPVTQDPDQMVIEAGYGLGEAVVSGQITPDTYLLDKRSLTIQEVQLNRQKQALHRSEGGGNAWSELEDHKIGARVLCDEEVMELAKIILRIEALSDFPVDVEWVQEKYHFFIVQARPITTLVRMVKHANQESDLSVLKTKVWTYDVSRRFNWFVQATQLKAMQRDVQVRYTGYQFPTENYLIANGDEYSCKEDQVRIHEQFSDAFKADEYFFQHLAVKIEGILAETERYTNALRHIDFQSFSTEKLRDALEHFSERYLVSFLPAWMRPDAFLESEVRSRLQQELGFSTAEVERAFAALATPLHHGLAYADEPLALLGIAKRIRSFQGATTLLSPVIEDLLKYHEECYGWMKSPVFPELRTFTVSEYRERITYLLEQPLDDLIHQRAMRTNENRRIRVSWISINHRQRFDVFVTPYVHLFGYGHGPLRFRTNFFSGVEKRFFWSSASAFSCLPKKS
jgi:hypothetical protein